jgi:hypothetical protein
MKLSVSLIAGCIVAALLTAGSKAQESPALASVPLPLVLSKAATYIEVYAGHLSGFVMEESYVQDVEQINRFGYRMNTRGGVSHRQLKSDLLLARPEGSDALKLPTSAAFADRPGAVIVGFNETQVRTLITTPQGKNLRAHGRFWFAMPDAEVLMTELGVDDYSLSATIHVAYERKPGLAVPVPIEMHELYVNRLNWSKVEGSATYSNFRQFDVKVDEQIAPVK